MSASTYPRIPNLNLGKYINLYFSEFRKNFHNSRGHHFYFNGRVTFVWNVFRFCRDAIQELTWDVIPVLEYFLVS